MTRQQFELDVLKEHLCPKGTKGEVTRAIIAWAYARLLAERCVVLVKAS